MEIVGVVLSTLESLVNVGTFGRLLYGKILLLLKFDNISCTLE